MENLVKSFALLFVLLNPFLMSIYLIGMIQIMNLRTFFRVLLRGTAISAVVFIAFAWLGDAIFTRILQVQFASFLIFGGIIFLLIGIRFFFNGVEAIGELRGDPEEAAVTIAMPYMIGPGTVSASVLAGSQLSPLLAATGILITLLLVVVSIMFFKWLFDYVKKRNEKFVNYYVDIGGRATALILGTFAVEMIFQGIEVWMEGR